MQTWAVTYPLEYSPHILLLWKEEHANKHPMPISENIIYWKLIFFKSMCASAGSRTRVDCLEGNHANRYTTDATTLVSVSNVEGMLGKSPSRVATCRCMHIWTIPMETMFTSNNPHCSGIYHITFPYTFWSNRETLQFTMQYNGKLWVFVRSKCWGIL